MTEELHKAQQAAEEAKSEAQKAAKNLKTATSELAQWEERRQTPFWKRWFKSS